MLISGSYNRNAGLIQNHIVNLSKSLNFYSSKYENCIIIGDFNGEMTNSYLEQRYIGNPTYLCLEEFCGSYNPKNLIRQPTCFKNLENPLFIDQILTNHPKSFHSSNAFETGLSDFHKLTTVLKVFHAKRKPKSSNIEISITLISII